jgi:hypothetical protein
VRRKSADEPWTMVARAIGVHEHTLARAATRLTGASLRDLAVDGASTVARHVERALLVPLIGDAARGVLGVRRRSGEFARHSDEPTQ